MKEGCTYAMYISSREIASLYCLKETPSVKLSVFEEALLIGIKNRKKRQIILGT